MVNVKNGELHFQFEPQRSQKEYGLACSLRHSSQDVDTATLGDPWMEDKDFDCVRSFKFSRCFHILPIIFSVHSSERSLPQWMLGNAMEKSQKATYVARPFCVMLYWMMESRQYIA